MKLGVCRGRHEMPVEDYIFDSIPDPTDLKSIKRCVEGRAFEKDGERVFLESFKEIDLYVTGLTVALVEVINFCLKHKIKLTLYHYNAVTNQYYSQKVSEG